MKLYLSSYLIQTPEDLAGLLDKPLKEASVALIPNAKDYYSEKARNFKIDKYVHFMEELGLRLDIVDLRDYNDPDKLRDKLAQHDLIWAMGGNTFVLRYEMQRAGFDQIIRGLLGTGIVYSGDSAGALVAGVSIAGVESADEPEFAEEIITEGLGLVPYSILPHADNPEFAAIIPIFEEAQRGKNKIIKLKDSQAVIFKDDAYRVVEK